MSMAATPYPLTPPRTPEELAACYVRHLADDQAISLRAATPRQQFEGLARAVRDLLMERWLATNDTYDCVNPKRVYYLSMEFLLGRSLSNNVTNLLLDPLICEFVEREGINWARMVETEPDAGLGNGGLGRLAACYLDSAATLGIPAIGYGLRYDFGIFRQEIVDGYQRESPDNWLIESDPWEMPRPHEQVEVELQSSVRLNHDTDGRLLGHPMTLLGVPYDRPIVGYGGRTVNTLRLWRAASPEYFDLGEFNMGDFVGAILHRVAAATVTRVLYPDDATSEGRMLRFVQEYFLVACSLADIVARFRRDNSDWGTLPLKVAIQLNDTHPALAVAELMRILLDQAKLGWELAWDLTERTLAYTNHTLLPEALETWPVELVERLLPRHLAIIYEINRRFLDGVRRRYPGDIGRVRRASLIEEGPIKKVRMAHLAIIGSHSTNGVARIHTRLLRSCVAPDLAALFPQRFNNKTNGVTPRRWLLVANPELSCIITKAIGNGWITDLFQLRRLLPLADDAAFRAEVRKAKRDAKVRFALWLRDTTDQVVDPDAIFDSQIKRIHEYKRQLLNLLQLIVQYHRLCDNPNREYPPRMVFFAGKAAPAYMLAKLIIKLINNVAAVINTDPIVGGRLKVHFLPDYNVSLAERLIPASDVSEQISTAGFEASGTSNMKFMMNGALTIGTRDGATIEMAEQAGEENLFLFGLTAEQVAASRGWYNPWWHYDHCPEIRRALDAIFSNRFSRKEPGIFEPIRDALLNRGDYFMHLADLDSYVATQDTLSRLYSNPDTWFRKVVLNVGASGRFSADRAIAEYVQEIWQASPCPPPLPGTTSE
jgi:starch phosphorylase